MPHTNTVILLERYCGTMTELGLPVVEPQHDEGLRDWQHLFGRTRFHYFEVLIHLICCYWDKENRSSYGGLRYIEVRYIEVPLYFHAKYIHTLSFKWGNDRRRTGEAFHSFIAFATLHKEPLYFF